LNLIETGLPGCVIIEPRVFCDERGDFFESFSRDAFAKHGLAFSFLQGNVSRSGHGVLRGLHYQWPRPQGKYVSVLDGEIWDVAVDIRTGSPTFGKWAAVSVSAENRRHIWIPPGFAHGFAVTSEQATVTYLCTETYDRDADAGIRWDDPALAIDWPVADPVLSDKDARAPLLGDVAADRLPVYTA